VRTGCGPGSDGANRANRANRARSAGHKCSADDGVEAGLAGAELGAEVIGG
jgi:hypothetical protein